MKPTLLLIEDEPAILRGLTDLFIYHGYDVASESDGKLGLQAAIKKRHSCVILDVMLPSMNGFEICQTLRNHSDEQPILMLTAKNAEQDIINGLTLGADDYVAKPFSTSELVLRVNALIRRSKKVITSNQLIISSNVSICARTLTGLSYKKETKYTRREVELLLYLQQADKPVSREELLREVWGYKVSHEVDTRTVDIHIGKLRKKIESNPRLPEHLVTHRGEGYQLYHSI